MERLDWNGWMDGRMEGWMDGWEGGSSRIKRCMAKKENAGMGNDRLSINLSINLPCLFGSGLLKDVRGEMGMDMDCRRQWVWEMCVR